MKLDVAPLISAIPKPPCAKGDPAYRAWYVARKQGWVSLYEASRIFDRAGKSLVETYPQLQGDYDGHVDDDLLRKCGKCDGIFVAHKAGTSGAPKRICEACRYGEASPKPCSKCGRIFMPRTRSALYCSDWCRRQVSADRQKKRNSAFNKRKVPRPCDKCSRTFMVRRTARAKYCEKCRLARNYEASGYRSDWPMCASCGAPKESSSWSTCAKATCRDRLKAARNAAKLYRISAEQVLILRSCPRCDACKTPFADESESAIDHCHDTWRIRGVLCKGCNSALGFMRDNQDKIRLLADYAEKYT